MAEAVENQERTFKHYLELPEKIRKFLIDEQEPDDRVRFTRCSKLCSQEAKASKNYIYGLSFKTMFRNHARIEVRFGENRGYCLKFARGISGRIKRNYYRGNRSISEETWTTSASVFQFAFEEFKKLLHTYQSKIKFLSISIFEGEIGRGDHIDFEIENLDNIEELKCCAQVDIQQFLSKIQHPLKRLCVAGSRKILRPEIYEQIMQVQDLSWKAAEPNYDQLERFSAKSAEIGFAKLTARDIFKFIRSWQDGSIGREIVRYEWSSRNSTFNGKKLLRLLRLENHERSNIKIKHFTETGKTADLDVTDSYVCFST